MTQQPLATDDMPTTGGLQRNSTTRIWQLERFVPLALTAVAILLLWHTWARWGDLQVDCGREVYVPIALLKGKLQSQ
jgi:hypothetical protein